MTVVCKATYELLPGQARLSSVQDYPNEEDSHWNDDPARSLSMASDLAPFKPRADVVLVGDAFAPGGQVARSLMVRLTVGSIDKRIEVFCDRHFTADGELVEGERFLRMPLRWERAAGGPDTSNPVGVDREAEPDRYGRRALPNLQPPGLHVSEPGDVIEPVCFAPIASGWPSRRRLLGPHAASWSDAEWHQQPFPANLDGSYFNVAPTDQRVAEIRPNERLVLEHLHPDEPSLTIDLPGIKPRAFVDRGGAVREVGLRADTLWIDTVRAVCAVTWRGRLEVTGETEKGRIVVAMEEPGHAVSWAEVSKQAAERDSGSQPDGPAGAALAAQAKAPPTMALKSVSDLVDEGTAVGIIPAPEGMPLPFVQADKPSQPPPSAVRPDRPRGSSLTTAVPVFSPPGDKSPAWLSGKVDVKGADGPKPLGPTPGSLGGPNPVSSRSSGPTRARSPVVALPKQPEPTPDVPKPAPAPASPAMAEASGGEPAAAPSPWAASKPGASNAPSAVASPPAQAPMPGPPAAPGIVPPSPPSPGVSPVPPNPAVVSAVSAAEPIPMSNAAAAAAPARAPAADEIVELLWFDPAAVDKIRANEPWTDIIADLQPEAADVDPLDFDAEPPPEEPQEVRDQRDIVGVMTRARCIAAVDLPRVMLNAVHVSGHFEPPVVMISGRLQFPFEPLERLKATVTAVTPVAAGDKPLKDTIDTVNEALQTPWLQSSGEVADGMTEKVRTAFKQANRMVSTDHLDDHVERILLEQRHYQQRTVFGGAFIRAQMVALGSREQVPTYLPADLGKELPMFASFTARVIAEAHVQQDQFESHDSALKVIALGRVINFTKAGRY